MNLSSHKPRIVWELSYAYINNIAQQRQMFQLYAISALEFDINGNIECNCN